MRSGPGAARTILLFHIISARPSKQPLMVCTFLTVCGVWSQELGSYFLFLEEQIKDIIILFLQEQIKDIIIIIRHFGKMCFRNDSFRIGRNSIPDYSESSEIFRNDSDIPRDIRPRKNEKTCRNNSPVKPDSKKNNARF